MSSRAAGGCVLVVLATTAAGAVFATAPDIGVLTVWGAGAVALVRAARHTVSDSSATPPPGGGAPLTGEEAGHSPDDETTLVTREGMLIYLATDADNPHRTHVHVEAHD